MKGKIIAVFLLAGVILSSSVNASPIIDVNSQRVISSYFYRLAVRILDGSTSDNDPAVNIVGGDADDYANGRTEENPKGDLINDAGGDDKKDKR